MHLTGLQTIIMILAIAAGTMLTRFTPFILFPESKEPPRVIRYLGEVLPCAVLGLLVVYCLRNVNMLQGNHGIPEAIGVISVVCLHLWKRNVLLSIAGGTICYMCLVQLVF